MRQRKMVQEEKVNKQDYLTHSLTGNTSGSNNAQTVLDILDKTTVKPSAQSQKSNGNQ